MGVPVKYSSMTSRLSPMASNACAAVYEPTVEIPILLITFMTPLPSAFR